MTDLNDALDEVKRLRSLITKPWGKVEVGREALDTLERQLAQALKQNERSPDADGFNRISPWHARVNTDENIVLTRPLPGGGVDQIEAPEMHVYPASEIDGSYPAQAPERWVPVEECGEALPSPLKFICGAKEECGNILVIGDGTGWVHKGAPRLEWELPLTHILCRADGTPIANPDAETEEG